jgi:hypothetical protein
LKLRQCRPISICAAARPATRWSERCFWGHLDRTWVQANKPKDYAGLTRPPPATGRDRARDRGEAGYDPPARYRSQPVGWNGVPHGCRVEFPFVGFVGHHSDPAVLRLGRPVTGTPFSISGPILHSGDSNCQPLLAMAPEEATVVTAREPERAARSDLRIVLRNFGMPSPSPNSMSRAVR